MPLIVKSNITNPNDGIRELYEDGKNYKIPILDIENNNIQDDVFKGWLKQFEEYHYVGLIPTSSLENDIRVLEMIYNPGEKPVSSDPRNDPTLNKFSAQFTKLVMDWIAFGAQEDEEKLKSWEEDQARYLAEKENLKSIYHLPEDFDFEEKYYYPDKKLIEPPEFFDKTNDELENFQISFHKNNFKLNSDECSILFKEGATYDRIDVEEIEIDQISLKEEKGKNEELLAIEKENKAYEEKALEYEQQQNKIPYYMLIEDDINHLEILKGLLNNNANSSEFTNAIKDNFQNRIIEKYLLQIIGSQEENQEKKSPKEQYYDLINTIYQNSYTQTFGENWYLLPGLEDGWTDPVQPYSEDKTREVWLFFDNNKSKGEYMVPCYLTSLKNQLAEEKILLEKIYLDYITLKEEFESNFNLLYKVIKKENGEIENQDKDYSFFTSEEIQTLMERFDIQEEDEEKIKKNINKKLNSLREDFKNDKRFQEIQETRESILERIKNLEKNIFDTELTEVSSRQEYINKYSQEYQEYLNTHLDEYSEVEDENEQKKIILDLISAAILKDQEDLKEWFKNRQEEYENQIQENHTIEEYDNLRKIYNRIEETYNSNQEVLIKKLTIINSIKENLENSYSYLNKIEQNIKTIQDNISQIVNIYKIKIQPDNECFIIFNPTEYSEQKNNPYLMTFYFKFLPEFWALTYSLENNQIIETENLFDSIVDNIEELTPILKEETIIRAAIDAIDFLNVKFIFKFKDEVFFTKQGTTLCCKDLREMLIDQNGEEVKI